MKSVHQQINDLRLDIGKRDSGLDGLPITLAALLDLIENEVQAREELEKKVDAGGAIQESDSRGYNDYSRGYNDGAHSIQELQRKFLTRLHAAAVYNRDTHSGFDTESEALAYLEALKNNYLQACRERDQMCATLTRAQEEGTRLTLANRGLLGRDEKFDQFCETYGLRWHIRNTADGKVDLWLNAINDGTGSAAFAADTIAEARIIAMTRWALRHGGH